jgi:hypothetical protein
VLAASSFCTIFNGNSSEKRLAIGTTYVCSFAWTTR